MSLFTSSTFSAFSLASSNFLTASSYVSPITFGTIVVSVPLLTLTDTLFFCFILEWQMFYKTPIIIHLIMNICIRTKKCMRNILFLNYFNSASYLLNYLISFSYRKLIFIIFIIILTFLLMLGMRVLGKIIFKTICNKLE